MKGNTTMPIVYSAGILFFKDIRKQRRYLLLRSSRAFSQISARVHVQDFWDFSKGTLEAGETDMDAARRESREEAGQTQYELIPGFKKRVRYVIRRGGKKKTKFVTMFLARASSSRVSVSSEHNDFGWFLYAEARERITLVPMRKILDAAESFLQK